MTAAPMKYESAEVSAAKNIVHMEFDTMVYHEGLDLGELDMIGAADRIVEKLIEHGVEIPKNLK